MKLAMKFNRDIFLTAPLWANWATLDRWGHIWIWEFEPQLECGGDWWISTKPETKHHRIGNVQLLAVNLMPRRIHKP